MKKAPNTSSITASRAAYATPLDNPHVLELLKRLGFDTVEQLLTEDTLFTRHFA